MWQFNPYAFVLLTGALVGLVFALIVWQRSLHSRVTRHFFILLADVVLLLLLTGLEMFAADAASILLIAKLEYIAYLSIPLVWLGFVALYSGYEWDFSMPVVRAVWALPVIDLILVWTNEWHHLHWQSTGAQTIEGFIYFARTYGPAFWITQIYLQSVLLATLVITLRASSRFSSTFRSQIAPLILASLLPWLGNLLLVTGLYPLRTLPAQPLAFALACIPIAWALFSTRLLDVVPTAYDTVVKSLSDAVLVLDLNDRVVDINPAMERLMGKSAAQVAGDVLGRLFPELQEILQRYHNVRQAQTELTLRDGEHLLTYDVRLSPIYDERGTLGGRVFLLREITALKQAEQLIGNYSQQLEQIHTELEAFSYTVANDLRAPLTSINREAEALAGTASSQWSADARESLQGLTNSTQRMHEMINNLLMFARLRELPEEKLPLDMTSLALAALERFRARLQQRGVVVTIMPAMPPALGQAALVEELFANFIGNAVKYIGHHNSAPQVWVSGARQGDVVRYEVRDNGVGIAPENQAKAFEMFSRFNPGEASGSGLGLAIVARIVQRLQGQVGVESVLGQGSTFWFTLPAAPELAA